MLMIKGNLSGIKLVSFGLNIQEAALRLTMLHHQSAGVVMN
jgi:hypothetical protein